LTKVILPKTRVNLKKNSIFIRMIVAVVEGIIEVTKIMTAVRKMIDKGLK